MYHLVQLGYVPINVIFKFCVPLNRKLGTGFYLYLKVNSVSNFDKQKKVNTVHTYYKIVF